MPRFSAFVDLGNYSGTTFTGFSGSGFGDYRIQGINFGDDGYNTNMVLFNHVISTVPWGAVNGIALVRSDFSIIGGWRLATPYSLGLPQQFLIATRSINVAIGNTTTAAAGAVAGGVMMGSGLVSQPFIAGASYNTQPWY
jgi:hypothetical protein